jgi:nucleobase:cation symporter-1, NCS1 family
MTPDSTLSSGDLLPVPHERRTWGIYAYASLWIAMSVCVPTYMLSSGLISGGMNWWQAIGTIMLGNLIVLVPMLLNAHAGTKYGIPYPVLIRASYGVKGANVPAILRAIVACGWFGIQTWIGGQAIATMLKIVWPVTSVPATEAVCFLLFWGINMYVVWRGLECIKFLDAFGAPFLIAASALLLWWVNSQAGGFGTMLSQPSRFQSKAEFFAFFVPALTGMVGFWATVALNIPDFTRYATSQRSQVIGQAIGLPLSMTLFAFVGVAVTSASAALFGEPIWDPVALMARFNQPFAAFIALVVILIATLTTNVAANVVSPANDFASLAPKYISFRTGGLITGVIGLCMMPWKLLADAGSYVFGWLVGYSAFMGPVAGVMIADYYVIRKRRLDVEALYARGGPYEYAGGYNYRAMAATAAGIAVALCGLAAPPLRWLYDYAWFVGFAVSAGAHVALMREPEIARQEIFEGEQA